MCPLPLPSFTFIICCPCVLLFAGPRVIQASSFACAAPAFCCLPTRALCNCCLLHLLRQLVVVCRPARSLSFCGCLRCACVLLFVGPRTVQTLPCACAAPASFGFLRDAVCGRRHGSPGALRFVLGPQREAPRINCVSCMLWRWPRLSFNVILLRCCVWPSARLSCGS